MQEFCSDLVLCASAIKTELETVSVTDMPLGHKGCPLQLVGCATSSLGIRTSASWADDNRKGTCCSPLLRPGQGCNCRTRTAQWKAERLCSGSCMKWVERSDIKHVPQMKTSWTFHHFYTSSKPQQVAHFWFQGSATCHSTSVFFFFFALTASRKLMGKLTTTDYHDH